MRTIMLSRHTWNDALRIFTSNPEFVATPESVKAAFSSVKTDDMAKKVITALDYLGIIDKGSGRLSSLGREWARPSTYSSACSEIIYHCYPSGVDSILRKKPFPREEAIKWLMENEGMNEAGASKNAGFLSWLDDCTRGMLPSACPVQREQPEGTIRPPVTSDTSIDYTQIPAKRPRASPEKEISVNIPANLPPEHLASVLTTLNNTLSGASLSITFV